MSSEPSREQGEAPATPSLQREITERLLLSALDEADAVERAETSLAHSEFLARAAGLVGMSLNSSVTRDAVAAVSLPILGTWSIVDLVEADGSISRLPMIHPEPLKQALLRELGQNWKPQDDDPFGVPAIRQELTPHLIADDVDVVLERAAHSPLNLELLRGLGIGSLLTIPMVSNGRLLGAVTFVSDKSHQPYSPDEVRLAQDLANRNAEALEHARLYTEAMLLREQAELATLNKLRFLANISHDLRTPLNSIIGYVELIGEEIHGPVTPAQQDDLARIRLNQAHLMELVNDLLAFVQAGTPRVNQIVPLNGHEAIARAVALIDNSMSRKSLHYVHEATDPDVVALGDQERVSQILVNLLANAVKFTARGGEITTSCTTDADHVFMHVCDTGIGIDADKLEEIFEPFVQVDGSPPVGDGVGLGLAISRDLARSMHGDLTVESARGRGSCFTLVLPRAQAGSLA